MDTNSTLTNKISDDTIKLLRECDAGIKMGIEAINEVVNSVKDCKLKKILTDSRDKHDRFQEEATELLHEYHDEGKEPGMMAKGMSWLKTNMKMTMDSSDSTVADLITDGCDMGIKSLNRYLNQYKTANDKAKKLTDKLLKEEENLREEMKAYL
ncbi:MAG: hypothetical protein IJF37_02205 [Lachnospiraceae bacterium]|nr:hypothetical protein [Lachnospiraceae bacterium]